MITVAYFCQTKFYIKHIVIGALFRTKQKHVNGMRTLFVSHNNVGSVSVVFVSILNEFQMDKIEKRL